MFGFGKLCLSLVIMFGFGLPCGDESTGINRARRLPVPQGRRDINQSVFGSHPGQFVSRGTASFNLK